MDKATGKTIATCTTGEREKVKNLGVSPSSAFWSPATSQYANLMEPVVKKHSEVWLAGSSCETQSRAGKGRGEDGSTDIQVTGTASAGTEVCTLFAFVLPFVTREEKELLSWFREFLMVL